MAAHTACRGVALRSIGHVCAALMDAFPPGDENAMTVIRRTLMLRSEERH